MMFCLKRKYGMAVLVTLLFFSSSFAQEVTVAVSLDKPQWVVSEYLTGTHFVYAYEADWIYEDKTVIDWMKRVKVGVIRYPCGTVTMYWHWDNLNGYAMGIWGKEYASAIDEYASIVKQVYPKAQIIADWKYGPREKKRFEESLKLIQLSKAIDIMEYHE